jgi:hypothetical protein
MQVDAKREWETPALRVLFVNGDTEGGSNAGDDLLEQS